MTLMFARVTSGLIRADQPLSCPDAGVLHRQAAIDARRRWDPARPLGRAVRQQHDPSAYKLARRNAGVTIPRIWIP